MYMYMNLYNNFSDTEISPTTQCIVDSLEGKLDALVTEGGANFSVGQKQLLYSVWPGLC